MCYANATTVKAMTFVENVSAYSSLFGDALFDSLMQSAFNQDKDMSKWQQWKPKKNDEIVDLVNKQLNEYDLNYGDFFVGAYQVDKLHIAVFVIIMNGGPSIRYYIVPDDKKDDDSE
jgi:hypothetical protein